RSVACGSSRRSGRPAWRELPCVTPAKAEVPLLAFLGRSRESGIPAFARMTKGMGGVTPFERSLRERIRAEGPITVEAYMAACNAHYYATRDPLGAGGDFTTAPEISQIFGELAGACLADCWRRAGAAQEAVYAELGPGRGTLAADALRVLRKAGFAGDAHLVETSPMLRAKQAEAVPGAAFHDRI